MTDQTANLQPRLTVAQAAKLMNVSERAVYMARRIRRSGRCDLEAAIMAGTLSVLAAIRLLDGPKRAPDGLRAIAKAWANATQEERETFLETVNSLRAAAKSDAT